MERYTYETIIIFRGDLTEDSYDFMIKKYQAILEQLGAGIHKIEQLGKKKLAYDIKGYAEGWYVLYSYNLDVGKIAELERIYRVDNEVIKFLTVRTSDNLPEPEKSEQKKCTQVDAMDVLLGLAEFV